jgi:hypothetical protein
MAGNSGAVDGEVIWKSADEVLAMGQEAREKLRLYVDNVFVQGLLPQPGTVSFMPAGPPCNDLSLANPYSEKKGILGTDQV